MSEKQRTREYLKQVIKPGSARTPSGPTAALRVNFNAESFINLINPLKPDV